MPKKRKINKEEYKDVLIEQKELDLIPPKMDFGLMSIL